MFTLDSAFYLIQSHGLLFLMFLAVLEGPIVTVIAAYLARMGYLDLAWVYLICLAGDLAGDALIYGLGRFGPRVLPERWLSRLGLSAARKLSLGGHFATRGGRTLLFGKWTHSAGLPIMLASGVGRMNFAHYMAFNLMASLPKTLLFVALGYYIGQAYAAIDTYLYGVSLLLLLLAVLAGVALMLRPQGRRA